MLYVLSTLRQCILKTLENTVTDFFAPPSHSQLVFRKFYSP
jgi:hypothetical protein